MEFIEKDNTKFAVTRTVTEGYTIEELTPVYDTKEEYEAMRSRLATEIYRIVNKI